MLLSNDMGSKVLSPGRPAKLGPLKISFSLHTAANLLVRIFVKHLRVISINTIGHMFDRSAPQSSFFGIGYM